MSGRVLDSDVLIDVLRGHPPAVEWFAGLGTDWPEVPGLVVMELIQDSNDKAQLQRTMKLVEPLPIVWPTVEQCDRALSNFRRFHLSHGLGLLDALIAACATGRSSTLLTFNVKHYRGLAELLIERPCVR